MKNVSQLKQGFILVIFATIPVFNVSFGMNADEIREIIKQEHQRRQQNEMSHYECELKKLDEAKKEIEKEEASWMNIVYKIAQYAADWNILPVVGMLAVAKFLPTRDDKLSNNKEHDEVVKRVIRRTALITWPLGLAVKKLAEIPKERQRRKETLERTIEETSKKIEEIKNPK